MNKVILEDKLKVINELIEKNYKDEKLVGVLAGSSGLSLFQFYYSKYIGNEKHSKLGLEILESCIDKINNGLKHPTYCSGAAGFGWALDHLSQENFLENDNDDLLGSMDSALHRIMINDLKKGHYDFLHGGIGYGFYFFNRFKNAKSLKLKGKYKKILDDFLHILEEQSIKDSNKGIKWLFYSSIKNKKEPGVYNLSLSHGISSIVSFLAKLYQHEEFKRKSERLLIGGLNYLVNSANREKNLISLFPNSIKEVGDNELNSRLAWCYGDLGVGMSIWNTAKVLNDKSLSEFSLKIFKHSQSRLTKETTRVVDAGICHGSFGNALIYNRMYKNTNDLSFKETAKFWIDDGVNKAMFEDGYAGFKKYDPMTNLWHNSNSLLEGIAGIGLTILDYISDFETNWDECLMIK